MSNLPRKLNEWHDGQVRIENRQRSYMWRVSAVRGDGSTSAQWAHFRQILVKILDSCAEHVLPDQFGLAIAEFTTDRQ